MIRLETFSADDQNGIPILKNIDEHIDLPCRLAIIGQSGSGKSTLAKAICGLLPQDIKTHGHIYYNHVCLQELSAKDFRKLRKQDLKYLVQEPYLALNPYLKIKRQLKESLINSKKSEDLLALLKLVDLEDSRILDAYPFELSGGQKQRVALLQCLINEPKVLILDEPTTALDPFLQMEMIELIKKYTNRHQVSLILISHDLKTVLELSDEVWVMYEGQIVEKIKTAKLLNEARHPYTLHLINSLRTLELFLVSNKELK